MLLTGFAKLAHLNEQDLNQIASQLSLPGIKDPVEIREVMVEGISGSRALIRLKKEHHHRTLRDIEILIEKSSLTPKAKETAVRTFHLLAGIEAKIHQRSPEEVTFHEIGALDSILDVCLVSALFEILSPKKFLCSPLPICDGKIPTEHGLMPAPAPAVMELLKNVPVYGVDSEGETVTPTAIALLKTLGAEFGKWPEMIIRESYRIYGGRVLPRIPNGAIFAWGGL